LISHLRRRRGAPRLYSEPLCLPAVIVELLRSSAIAGVVIYPVLRCACTGLSTLDAYGILPELRSSSTLAVISLLALTKG
ncbi:MAG: hypothetical protein LBL94_10735, partial [Prevotellaceae bacterium]|nr:hypothetical protein [Prevotellaceae bacterium]